MSKWSLLFAALSIWLCAFTTPAFAWGLKTEKKMIICDSKESAERLKAAHAATSLALKWPATMTIKGCHFVKAGERIQPHGASAHDPADHDIIAVELPNTCEMGWTTDWIYQTRTDSNEDESIPAIDCKWSQ
jgi:hypothetical protein